MFCQECGIKTDEDALYCQACGTKLDVQSEFCGVATKNVNAQELYGILLTNVHLLAKKFGVDEGMVRQSLEKFIEGKVSHGVHYRLVDLSNHVCNKKNALGFTKTFRIKTKASIWDCMEILMDIHNHEIKQAKNVSNYLFIMGGDDVVPMPCINHFAGDCPDTNIDTDILYAYPYGEDVLDLLENGCLFECDPLYLVGRLPVEKDMGVNEWINYMRRALDSSSGILLTGAYAQCDPNWKNVTAIIADELITNDWLKNLDGSLSGDCYFRRLILSPRIDVDSVDQLFREDASLYYYNLHGSVQLEERAYYGRTASNLMTLPVLYPEHMSDCSMPNVVVCEACYGARFIGLDRQHSILLASLYSNTLAFVGSSRIAWGAVDPSFVTGYEMLIPECADVIAHTFMSEIMKGITFGEAMLLSRMQLLKKDFTPHALTSVVEFNLFGDPTLSMDIPNAETLDMTGCKIVQGGFVLEKMNISDVKSHDSALWKVQQAVDENINQIQSLIAQHLYRYYGIEPRPADYVYRVKYPTRSSEMNFIYNVSCGIEEQMEYVVRTTEKGEVKSVIVSK